VSREARRLRLGLPKGSLQETTQRLFNQAGYNLRITGRSYYPETDDPELECILIRPQEIGRYVEQGVIDAGIAGLDWFRETRAKVKELADLHAPWPSYRPVRWVLAVKQASKFRRVRDLEGKRIATEVVGLTRAYLRRHGVRAHVEFSWGATEVKPPILADAIVDVSETGAVNRDAYALPWKRRKLEHLVLMLRGAIQASERVGLMMNVPRERLPKVIELLPALGTPTISTLADADWVALNTVVEERLVRELIPLLAEVGARGIVEYPLNKIIG
jgi:ATP phosphoribosyltransferase